VRLWKKTSEGSISTVFVEKHPPFRQHPAWILTLVSVLTLRQMDGSLDFSLLLRDPHPYIYLVDVLQRIDTHPAFDVHLLTPRLWKQHFAAHPLRSDLDRLRQ
jgi:hypothetical protein